MISKDQQPKPVPVVPAPVRHGLEDDTAEAPVRAPRYALALQVWFSSTDGLDIGQSVNISTSGMLVDFEKVMDVWLTGELSLLVHEHSLKLKARVARVEGAHVALTFRIRSVADRDGIEELIAVALEQAQLLAPVLQAQATAALR